MSEQQGTLFAPVSDKSGTHERVCGQPILAGNTDAATSHEAAAELVRSGAHAKRCLEALRILATWPYVAPTVVELSHGNSELRYMLARRLPDCRARFLVENGEERPCRVTGKQAQTWRMTSAGYAALRGTV